jgi:hypothetical protein
MFCRSLFVLLYFFFWPLCCLFLDLRILITSLWYLQNLLTVLFKMYVQNVRSFNEWVSLKWVYCWWSSCDIIDLWVSLKWVYCWWSSCDIIDLWVSLKWVYCWWSSCDIIDLWVSLKWVYCWWSSCDIIDLWVSLKWVYCWWSSCDLIDLLTFSLIFLDNW